MLSILNKHSNSSSMNDKEYDMKIFGPGIWHVLHTSAAYATDKQKMEEFERFLEIIKKTIRCEDCRKHMQDFIDKNPLSSYQNVKSKTNEPLGYYVWTWKFHNDVNKRLGKKELMLKDTYEYYTGNRVCFACIASQISKLS